jgi:hypothetical protein
MTERSGTSGSSEGRRGRIDAARALRGLRSHLTSALIPAVVLAVVAGSTAGAVTFVALSGATVAEGEAGESAATAPAEDAPDGSGTSDLPVEGASPVVGPIAPADGAEDLAAGPDGATLDPAPTVPDAMQPRVMTFAETVAAHGAPDYAAILTRRFPGAQWSLNGSSYAGLTWLDGTPQPSRTQLDALWPEVAQELAAERAERAAAEARRTDPAVTSVLDSFDPRTIWGPSPDYSAILSRRFPGAQWSLNGNDPVNGLTWISGGTKPTKAQLDAMWADVAREMALEMDPAELARWAGTSDQIYVDGVLRPRGWVGGANDPQPNPGPVTDSNWMYLPQVPSDGGSPVGSIDIYKDPTGGKNFEQMYGVQLHELGRRIAAAHGYWGDQYGSVGLGLNGDRTLMWYSSLVDRGIVVGILDSMGALPADRSAPAPTPAPDPAPPADDEPGDDEPGDDEGED